MSQKIDITWKGKDYSIPANETFELGEEIEDVISLAEISNMAQKPNFRRIARCYSIILNFAGAHTNPQEIHSVMMDQMKNGEEAEQLGLITSAIQTLLAILMDGAPEEMGEGAGDGKKQAAVS